MTIGNDGSDAAHGRTVSSESELSSESEGGFDVAPRLLAVVHELQLATPDTFPDKLRHALAVGAQLLGAERSFLRVFDPQGRRIIARFAWSVRGEDDDPELADRIGEARRVFQWTTKRFLRGELSYIRTLDDLPPEASGERAFFEERGVRSWLSIPIRSGDRTVAYQSFETMSFEKAWTDAEIDTARLLAGILASAIVGQESEVRRLESQQRFERMVAEHPDGLLIVRLRDFEILECNDTWLDMFQLERGAAIGRCLKTLASEHGFETDWERLQQLGEGEDVLDAELHADENGQRRVLWVSGRRVEMDGQASALITTRDVTERKRIEKHLRESQKTEALGLLAGGIAHELNNLLTVIMGYSESLATESQEEAGWILEAATRSARLTRKLLILARNDLGEARPCEVGTLLQERLPDFEAAVGGQVAISLELAAAAVVRVDPVLLEQAILNLVVNAADAVERDGSEVKVRCGVGEIGREGIPGGPALPAGRYATIEVHDRGPGISDAIAARVREPFFTTRPERTGLGLTIVDGIAQRLRGGLTITSGAGSTGTLARLILPLAATEPAAVPSWLTGSGLDEGGLAPQRVMVVEDEDALRRLATRQLEAMGHKVHAAVDGADALAQMRESAEAFDVVVTDVVMPNLGGLALVEALRADGCGAAVIIVSGYPGLAPGDRERALPEGAIFLHKPYGAEELRRALSEALTLKASGDAPAS